MHKKYPTLSPEVHINLFGEMAEISSTRMNFSNFSVNKDAALLLSKCDGQNNAIDILNIILDRDPKQEEISNAVLFFNQLKEKNIIVLNESPKQSHINIKGSFDKICPKVVSLELTNKCNFNCSYCYQNSNIKKNDFLQEPIMMLKFLKNFGVIGIELTGGEPLMHPLIDEIIAFITSNFSLLGLITNGSLLTERHLNLLKSSRCKIAIQICLDGHSKKLVEKTTGIKRSFEMEVNAIKLVKKHGFILRVGMVIDNPEKIDSIENTLLLAKQLGADSFVVNPTIDFGRGETTNKCFTMDDFIRLDKLIVAMKDKYKGFFSKETDNINFDLKMLPNCGGGHRDITIRWDGKVKNCPLMNAEDLSLGSWKELDAEKTQKKFKAFFQLEDPKKNVCGNCKFALYCQNCSTRAFRSANKLLNKNECAWYVKNQALIDIIQS